MTDLTGKVAVITGAASGIGYGSVEVFVEAGAQVVAADISETGAELEDRFGPDKVRFIKCDVTSKSDLDATMKLCADSFGGIDAVFNNAGAAGSVNGVEDFDPDGFDRTVNLLLKSVIQGTQAALPYFKERGGGSVINTSSTSARSAGHATMTYSLCKAAVAHFSKIAAAELAQYHVRVNAVLPGLIATRIFGGVIGQDRDQAAQTAELIAQVGGAGVPVGRAGEGRDIGNVAAFLASDASAFVNGTEILADGGSLIGPSRSWNPEEGGGLAALLGAQSTT
ncbi:MAG: SDR family oxidoreductase [Alphaproteobacteria bacterium]